MGIQASKQQATFVFVPLPNGKFAATTRAKDRGEEGRIGLPGGKVDPGETLVQAAYRECAEEGWLVSDIEDKPFFSLMVNGFEVFHYVGKNPVKLETFKEQGRIAPIEVTLDDIAASGWGNEETVIAFQRHMSLKA